MGNGSLTNEWLKGGVAAIEVSGNGAKLPQSGLQSFATGAGSATTLVLKR